MNYKSLEYPVECTNCGRIDEEDTFDRFSLDAYADLSVDYDLACPGCGSTDLTFHKPREDRYER